MTQKEIDKRLKRILKEMETAFLKYSDKRMGIRTADYNSDSFCCFDRAVTEHIMRLIDMDLKTRKGK